MRMVLAWLLGLGGIAAVGFGAVNPWYEGKPGTQVPLMDLFTGPHRESAPIITSMAVPLAILLLAAVFGLARSKLMLQAAGGLLLVTLVAWTLRARDAVSVADLQSGLWNAVFGSLLILMASALR